MDIKRRGFLQAILGISALALYNPSRLLNLVEPKLAPIPKNNQQPYIYSPPYAIVTEGIYTGFICYLGHPNSLPCDGRTIPKDTYSQLFTLVGTTYGSTYNTFNLPDLRARVMQE